MKEELYSHFNKRSTFIRAFVASIVFFIANIIVKIIIGFSDPNAFSAQADSYSSNMLKLSISAIFLVACIIAFCVAFLKHNKNVQKMLLGAILFWYVIDQASFILSQITTGSLSEMKGTFGVIIEVIILLLFILFFISTLIINSDKSDKPSYVYFNQVIIVLLIGLSLIKAIYCICTYDGNLLPLLENLFWQVAYIFFLEMIISFQTEIDYFRSIRKM